MHLRTRVLISSGFLSVLLTLAAAGWSTMALADDGGDDPEPKPTSVSGPGGPHPPHHAPVPVPPPIVSTVPPPIATPKPQPVPPPAAPPAPMPAPTHVPVPALPDPPRAALVPPPPTGSEASRPRPARTPTPGAKRSFAPPPASQPPSVAVPMPVAVVADQVFDFGADFADLQAQLGSVMGSPVEDEHLSTTPDSCDQEQRTSTGLAYVRCDSGLSSFVADPDGQYHWAWLGDRVAAWIGYQIDPPDVALESSVPVCVGPASGPYTACPLRGDMPVAGFLREPGDTDAYMFTLANGASDVALDLSNLPADYDLYLTDSAGTMVGQSVQDGTAAEHIEQPLPADTYYVYVHVDVGRAADAFDQYTLRLTSSDS